MLDAVKRVTKGKNLGLDINRNILAYIYCLCGENGGDSNLWRKWRKKCHGRLGGLKLRVIEEISVLIEF